MTAAPTAATSLPMYSGAFLRQTTNLKDLVLPLLLPGIKINTSPVCLV